MGIQEFIEKNREFWQDNIIESGDKKLLIEEANLPCIIQDLAIHAIVLNKAKGYIPNWIYSDNVSLELLKSYNSSAEYIKMSKLNAFEKIKVYVSSILQFAKILINRNILSVRYDGVKYGDIVYDVYLSQEQVGTIKNIDFKIFELIRRCIKRHVLTVKTVKNNNISAVLVSHRIGLTAGVLLRASLRAGCEVYSLAGMHRATLTRSKDMSEMIKYEYTPDKKDIEELTALPQEKFDKLYEFVRNFHIYGNCNMDAKFAFSDDNKFYQSREEFAKDYNLDVNKKNIFVMLHAFTDYPHSHFKWMIFKDYGDWFLKTLEFAKKDKNVNWIFKQHPADKFYPTKDIKFDKLFQNLPENVVFLDYKSKLDTRSLMHIADAIVTCLGTAGFEVPAMSGVASITAADNHYTGHGFSKNPTTKKEYFDILKDLKNIKKLTAEELKIARAVYMFIYYFCSVDFTALPILTMEEHHKPNMDDWYWDMVVDLYNTKGNIILSQIDKYAKNVAKEDFSALRSRLSDLEKEGAI